MHEVHLRLDRARSLWIQCLPDDIYRGELFDGAGGIKRKNMMASLETSLGPNDPMLSQFEEITPPQEPRFVVVRFGGSGVNLRIRHHDSEPPLEFDGWETIEQVGAEFGELEATAEIDDSRTKTTDPKLDRLLRQVAIGWNMIRAYRRGFNPRKRGSEVLIDIWRLPGPFHQEHIKHQPAVPELPRVPPGADEYQQWSRIAGCLQRGGSATIADRAKGRPYEITERVTSALTKAGLDPRQSPAQWFHILTLYPDDRWTTLIPGYRLLTIEQSLKVRQHALTRSPRVSSNVAGAGGEPAPIYVPEYIPLAESDTSILVFDSHPGPYRGLIRELVQISTPKKEVTWKSLVHFLGDLAFALENRKLFLGFRPQFNTNNLEWEPGTT